MSEIDDAVETIKDAEQDAHETANDIVDSAFDTASDVVDDAHTQAEAVIAEASDAARDLEIHGRIDGLEARLQSLEGGMGNAASAEPTVVEVHHEPPAEPEPEPEPEPTLDVGQDELAAPPEPPPVDDIAPNKRNRHWFYR